jgi:Ca2+-binding RTX toxin-like protein
VTVDGGGSCGASSDMRGTINLALLDPDDPPESLTLSATSSNRSVVPNRNISFGGGTDASRTLTVSSLTGSGTSTLTITLSDGDQDNSVEVRVIAGSAANNTLTGSALSEMIFARKGRDSTSGQGAIDLLCGGNGNDKLTGGAGAADHFGGGSGTDTATDFNAGEGDTKGASRYSKARERRRHKESEGRSC